MMYMPLKNGKERTITLTTTALNVLKEAKRKQSEMRFRAGSSWENEHNMIFTRENGRFVRFKTLYVHFKAIVKKMGRPEVRFHDVRHTDVKQATKNNEHFIRISKSQENRYTIADTLSSVSISESILEGGFDFYPVIMKNVNFADSALC